MTRAGLLVTRWGTRFGNRHFASAIGRGGIVAASAKREGDGATPAGTHQIVGALYRADRLAPSEVPRWAHPIGPSDLWSDDPRDPDYNHRTQKPHGFSHETLHRADSLYDLILLTDWNWPNATRGHGSAIFLHTWRRPRYPTAGCVAFARADLLWIANTLSPGARIIIRA